MLKQSIVAVDPSIRSAGIAHIQVKKLPASSFTIKEVVTLKAATTINMPWEVRAFHTATRIIDWIVTKCSSANCKCLIELPALRLDTKGVAALQSEGIQKLYTQVGNIVGVLLHLGYKVYGVHPIDWKGGLPKSLVAERFARFAKNICNKNLSTPQAVKQHFIKHTWSHDAIEALAMAAWFIDAQHCSTKLSKLICFDPTIFTSAAVVKELRHYHQG